MRHSDGHTAAQAAPECTLRKGPDVEAQFLNNISAAFSGEKHARRNEQQAAYQTDTKLSMRHAPWRHRESTGCGDCVWRRQRTGVTKLRALELNSVIHIHHNGRAVYVGDGEHDVTRNGNVRRCGFACGPPAAAHGRACAHRCGVHACRWMRCVEGST